MFIIISIISLTLPKDLDDDWKGDSSVYKYVFIVRAKI